MGQMLPLLADKTRVAHKRIKVIEQRKQPLANQISQNQASADTFEVEKRESIAISQRDGT